jgi:TPR repeat protein
MQQYPDAMYALGTWYLHGKGDLVKLDLTRAIELIRAAAEAGNIEAMYDLAVSYDKGAGNVRDLERAFEWFLRAAIRGDADATFCVGRCYRNGDGIAKDLRLAAIWDQRTTELGTDPLSGDQLGDDAPG